MRKKKFTMDSKFTRSKPLPNINNMKNPSGVGKINTALIAGERYKADRFVDVAAGMQHIVDNAYDREVKLYEQAQMGPGKAGPNLQNNQDYKGYDPSKYKMNPDGTLSPVAVGKQLKANRPGPNDPLIVDGKPNMARYWDIKQREKYGDLVVDVSNLLRGNKKITLTGDKDSTSDNTQTDTKTNVNTDKKDNTTNGTEQKTGPTRMPIMHKLFFKLYGDPRGDGKGEQRKQNRQERRQNRQDRRKKRQEIKATDRSDIPIDDLSKMDKQYIIDERYHDQELSTEGLTDYGTEINLNKENPTITDTSTTDTSATNTGELSYLEKLGQRLADKGIKTREWYKKNKQ